jgi:hypothetical protein
MDTPIIGSAEWYAQYACEKCGTQGVCESGMDVFIASLCQECFDIEWRGYLSAVLGREVRDAEYVEYTN